MASTVGLAPGLSRKLKKVLECRTDSPDLVASLNALSSFYDENSAHARRNLRSTIEKRALEINREFLSAADSTQIALDRVEEEVNALADCCDKIAAALSSSAATTSDIISTTERLKQELEVTTQRQEIVNCFLRDYQLSNEEVSELLPSYLDGDQILLCVSLCCLIDAIFARLKRLGKMNWTRISSRLCLTFRRFIQIANCFSGRIIR